jgi:hypothetical protein
MIHVDHTRVSPPAGFDQWRTERIERLRGFYGEMKAKRTQREIGFSLPKELRAGVSAALHELFSRKCGYCETPFTREEGIVDHFRPKHRASDLRGKVSSEHYAWLAYDWNNLILSCSVEEEHIPGVARASCTLGRGGAAGS